MTLEDDHRFAVSSLLLSIVIMLGVIWLELRQMTQVHQGLVKAQLAGIDVQRDLIKVHQAGVNAQKEHLLVNQALNKIQQVGVEVNREHVLAQKDVADQLKRIYIRI